MRGPGRAADTAKVEDANMVAEATFRLASEAHRHGRGFAIENPANSFMWGLECAKELEILDGVRQVVFTNCCFSGGLRCKLTAVLTNMVELLDAMGGRRCEGRVACERTGLPHRSWRPEVVAGEIVGYPTEEEAEYPEGLCEVAAGAILEWVDSHGKGAGRRYLFTEVFAGARAPLTHHHYHHFSFPLSSSSACSISKHKQA